MSARPNVRSNSGKEMLPKGSTRYPFVPRSTARLCAGQFWSIPLLNGRWACGRVLQLKVTAGGRRDSRAFLAGLMNWSSRYPPTSDTIAGAQVLEQGQAHIKTIRENGGIVLGYRALEADGIEPGL